MVKPHNKTIRTVIEYLNSLELSVYGPNMDVNTGQEFPSLMDYNAEEVIKRAKHLKNETNWRDERNGL